MTNELDDLDGCGCGGCLLMLAFLCVGIGLLGLAVKFMIWAWR